MSNFSNNSNLDEIIQEVKQEFKCFLIKRRELILRLGDAFEKVVANPEGICEEIKIALHEEIAEHIISARDIERYCPDKWKNKTKPQKNDKMSILKKTEEQEKEEHCTIVMDAKGSLVDEPKPISSKSQICNEESNFGLETQEISKNIHNNAINLHTCPNCKQALLENQRIHHEKDIRIQALKDEIQQYRNDLNVKRSENAGIQAQINHLNKKLQEKDENNGSILSASNAYHQVESNPIVDIEFSLSYENVRKYVSSRLKITGVLGTLWFNCKLDKRTYRIISAYPGSIVERKEFSDSGDKRNEQRQIG